MLYQRELRVMKDNEKFSLFIAFKWDSMDPGGLSITHFMPGNIRVDEADMQSFSVSVRGAVQRALQCLALMFHVVTGEAEAGFLDSFSTMIVALQGEKAGHIPDAFLMYVINACMQRVCYSFRRDPPPANDPEYFLRGGAFRMILRSTFNMAVSRLPASTESLQRVREFERDLYPEIRFAPRQRGGSVDSDRSGGRESSDTETSRRGTRGARSKRKTGESGQGNGSSAGPDKRNNTGVTPASSIKVEKSAVGSSAAGRGATPGTGTSGTPCPYYLAEQLGIPTSADPNVMFQCLDGKNCTRGRHMSLSQLTRKKAKGQQLLRG